MRKTMAYLLILTGVVLSFAELFVTPYSVSDLKIIVFVVVAGGLLGIDHILIHVVRYLANSLQAPVDGADGSTAEDEDDLHSHRR